MSNGYGYYKKLCTSHHKKKYGMKMSWKRNHLSEEPCSKCGWHESYCDTHRLKPGKDGGKYEKENIIALCPNCHRAEHNKKSISDC